MNTIKDLITALQDTDIVEFQFEKNSFKLQFTKNNNHVREHKLPAPPSFEKPVEKSPHGSPENTLVEIQSTMVGTFFASASASRPPFIIEGDHIMPGQKLGMIEAMKVMKDVIATVRGRVKKVLITNGHAVEYGQPLFLIDTSNGNQ
ncbi:MAG: acetyl-CoA carboxylase, biotin carboxyl carrier protein [Elusimicrobia bacterium]|nr:acetyl-CoA carboxylase, biotin carboxyl carrier protein [Elusimicrobiota bacterium]MBD3411819.1 acetyl-CoA carboxylase, biotin carboxyl carrier protein [Elusimicrobiota bacterium]